MPRINYKAIWKAKHPDHEPPSSLPSVTTIIGRFKNATPLMRWAWKQGCEGKSIDYERDKAATIGTLCHALVERHIHGKPYSVNIPEAEGLKVVDIEKAVVGYNAFVEWTESNHFKITQTEISLVSVEYEFGGTLDWLGTLNDRPFLGDLKTSNASYTEYIYQLAAYRHLLTENGYERPEKFGLLRVGKDYGDFHSHSWPAAVLDEAWTAFLAMRQLYAIDAKLKKVAA